MDLQLWSRLGCFGILQDSQLSTQGRRTASFGATTGLSSAAVESFRIPSSRLKVGGQPPLELQLWSRLGCSGILRHIRIPSSFPALSWEEDNLLWSYNFGLGSAALESFGILGFLAHSQLSAGRRTTSFGATTLVSARLLWNH